MFIAVLVKEKMSYLLTMSEQKARRQRRLRRCALLSLGIMGLALLLLMHPLPCHDRSQTQRPYLHTYKSDDGGSEAQ